MQLSQLYRWKIWREDLRVVPPSFTERTYQAGNLITLITTARWQILSCSLNYVLWSYDQRKKAQCRMFHLSPLRNKMLWWKGHTNPSDHSPPPQSKAGLKKTFICDIIFIQQELEGSLHCCRSKWLPEYSKILLGYLDQSCGKYKAECLMLFPQIVTINFSLELAVPFSQAGPAYPGEQSQRKKSQPPTHLPWTPQEAIPLLWHISSVRTQPGALFKDSAGCSKS